MPIIDPVWTLTMVALVLIAGIAKKPRIAVAALVFAGLYFSFGAWQHSRAVNAIETLAARRGHAIEHFRATPSIGALSLWRGVYVSDGELHADGIFVPYIGQTRVRTGQSRVRIDVGDIPGLAENADAKRQFEVFRWFADGLLVPVEGLQC
jgi:inner membrane protein